MLSWHWVFFLSKHSLHYNKCCFQLMWGLEWWLFALIVKLNDMFLLVSIQSSRNLGKTFLRISHLRKTALTWILARMFVHLSSLIFQILDFICVMVSTFIFDCVTVSIKLFDWVRILNSMANVQFACCFLLKIFTWFLFPRAGHLVVDVFGPFQIDLSIA